MSIDRQDLKHIGLITAVGVLLCAGVWFGLRQMHDSLDQRSVELRERLGLSQGASSLERLQKKVALLEIDYDQRTSYVPSQPDTGAVHAAVSEALTGIAISGQAISAEAPLEYQKYGVVPVEVSFQGRFTDIQTFLKRIENANRLIGIKRFEVESSPRDEGLLRATVELTAYYADHQSVSGNEVFQ